MVLAPTDALVTGYAAPEPAERVSEGDACGRPARDKSPYANTRARPLGIAAAPSGNTVETTNGAKSRRADAALAVARSV